MSECKHKLTATQGILYECHYCNFTKEEIKIRELEQKVEGLENTIANLEERFIKRPEILPPTKAFVAEGESDIVATYKEGAENE